ncbi:hypothetical protein [Gordonia neofelifaecis]|uniref:Uncharacterized protein n=1 Tax=Gordonia neofelifaecis NRRL B-59395 TaxID=644548 RepID=F1YEB8_9ACTN|nr:hypothetical protein [Gordonia neofelifaecis]EGD56751.1 hypothetical protein SCNU_00195 [Gordonia neofelifaecis NRRL B-59395]
MTSRGARRAEIAVHEAGHSVAAVLLGARVNGIHVGDELFADRPGWTKYVIRDDVRVPDREIIYAGPWAEARWRAGRAPGRSQIMAALAGTEDLDDLQAAQSSGELLPSRDVNEALEELWRPAILPVAKLLCEHGTLTHRDVADVLGLSTFDGPIFSTLAGPDRGWHLRCRSRSRPPTFA